MEASAVDDCKVPDSHSFVWFSLYLRVGSIPNNFWKTFACNFVTSVENCIQEAGS